jgi:hypothetical protein
LSYFQGFLAPNGDEAGFTSLYHPDSNGAVEKTNTQIFLAIKKILKE